MCLNTRPPTRTVLLSVLILLRQLRCDSGHDHLHGLGASAGESSLEFLEVKILLKLFDQGVHDVWPWRRHGISLFRTFLKIPLQGLAFFEWNHSTETLTTKEDGKVIPSGWGLMKSPAY